jgi:transcriptional regulator with XRE-family HTH domain
MSSGNPYPLSTPEEVARELSQKAQRLRLARKWKQSTLAERSGVTLASLRRFERTGQVSLKNLLRLSFALGRLGDFDNVLHQPEAGSIAELESLAAPSGPKRGTR